MNLQPDGISSIFNRISALHARFKIPFPAASEFQRLFAEEQEKQRADNYRQIIDQAARDNNLDPDLVRAVVKAESNYEWGAVSKKGALGLMQLMPGTAKELGVENPFDVSQNVNGGAKYLQQLLKRYDNDVEKALAAYNSGPSNVDRHNGVPPFKETKEYVNRVLGTYRSFKDGK